MWRIYIFWKKMHHHVSDSVVHQLLPSAECIQLQCWGCCSGHVCISHASLPCQLLLGFAIFFTRTVCLLKISSMLKWTDDWTKAPTVRWNDWQFGHACLLHIDVSTGWLDEVISWGEHSAKVTYWSLNVCLCVLVYWWMGIFVLWKIELVKLPIGQWYKWDSCSIRVQKCSKCVYLWHRLKESQKTLLLSWNFTAPKIICAAIMLEDKPNPKLIIEFNQLMPNAKLNPTVLLTLPRNRVRCVPRLVPWDLLFSKTMAFTWKVSQKVTRTCGESGCTRLLFTPCYHVFILTLCTIFTYSCSLLWILN